jgi:hypothetical protein
MRFARLSRKPTSRTIRERAESWERLGDCPGIDETYLGIARAQMNVVDGMVPQVRAIVHERGFEAGWVAHRGWLTSPEGKAARARSQAQQRATQPRWVPQRIPGWR